MKLLNIYSLGLGVLLLGLVPTSAMGFSLDVFSDFESGIQQQVYSNEPFGGTSLLTDTDTGLNTANVFGGQRKLTVSDENGGGETVLLRIKDNSAKFSVNTGTIGKAKIEWDGLNNTGSYLNITNNDTSSTTIGDQRSFQLNIESLNLGGTGSGEDLELKFDLEDTNNNVATITRTINTNLANTDIYFAYDNRIESTGDAGGDIDLTKIDYVAFQTSSENIGDDFEFNLIESSTVPFEFSPSLGIILCGGLFGIHKLRKRLQSN